MLQLPYLCSLPLITDFPHITNLVPRTLAEHLLLNPERPGSKQGEGGVQTDPHDIVRQCSNGGQAQEEE